MTINETIVKDFFDKWDEDVKAERVEPFSRLERVAITIFMGWLGSRYIITKKGK